MIDAQGLRVCGAAIEAHSGAMRYAFSRRSLLETAARLVDVLRPRIASGVIATPDAWVQLQAIYRIVIAVTDPITLEALTEARNALIILVAAEVVQSTWSEDELGDGEEKVEDQFTTSLTDEERRSDAVNVQPLNRKLSRNELWAIYSDLPDSELALLAERTDVLVARSARDGINRTATISRIVNRVRPLPEQHP